MRKCALQWPCVMWLVSLNIAIREGKQQRCLVGAFSHYHLFLDYSIKQSRGSLFWTFTLPLLFIAEVPCLDSTTRDEQDHLLEQETQVWGVLVVTQHNNGVTPGIRSCTERIVLLMRCFFMHFFYKGLLRDISGVFLKGGRGEVQSVSSSASLGVLKAFL